MEEEHAVETARLTHSHLLDLVAKKAFPGDRIHAGIHPHFGTLQSVTNQEEPGVRIRRKAWLGALAALITSDYEL